MVWMTGDDGLCTFFNKRWLDFTGRTLNAELGNGWADGVHPQDREDCIRQFLSAFELRESFAIEYRLLRHDGSYRCLLDHGTPRYNPDGAFLGYIGSCIDITERKEAENKLRQLSVQLIHAQETERHRIGQELHDDLSQRAAVLSLSLSYLAKKYDHSQEGSRELAELQRQAADLCRNMARISHQLRPVTLERLGLLMGLRGLCQQATNDQHTVELKYEEGLPPLSGDVTVSLYRIAQEALRNALTHSRASQIQIDVRASGTAVRLSITDNGCGFVVGSVVTYGLGLSGMNERMKNVGGRIFSSPGKGTTVTALAPIVKAMRA
jgi:PAS domain S-box-containing protein